MTPGPSPVPPPTGSPSLAPATTPLWSWPASATLAPGPARRRVDDPAPDRDRLPADRRRALVHRRRVRRPRIPRSSSWSTPTADRPSLTSRLAPAGPLDAPALRGVSVPGGDEHPQLDLGEIVPRRGEAVLQVGHQPRAACRQCRRPRYDELGRRPPDSKSGCRRRTRRPPAACCSGWPEARANARLSSPTRAPTRSGRSVRIADPPIGVHSSRVREPVPDPTRYHQAGPARRRTRRQRGRHAERSGWSSTRPGR